MPPCSRSSRAYDTPTICNALEIVDPARRLTGFTLKPLVCPSRSCADRRLAKTATIRTTQRTSSTARSSATQRIDYYEYIAAKPAPGILVIQDLDGAGRRLRRVLGRGDERRAQGARPARRLTDGSIRDIDQWAPGFLVLAGSAHAEPRARAPGRLRQGGTGCRDAGAFGRHRARRPARRGDDPGAVRQDPRRLRPARAQGGGLRGDGPRAPAPMSPSCARPFPCKTRSARGPRMRHKVICIQPILPEGMKILHSRDDLKFHREGEPRSRELGRFPARRRGARRAATRPETPRSLIEAAPNLKLISRHGVGCDDASVSRRRPRTA